MLILAESIQRRALRAELGLLTMRYVSAMFLLFLLVCNVCLARKIYVHAGSQARTADGSETSPFKTISEALNVVESGDTVIVREGVYRESIRVPGGQRDKPVSIRSADGERVVLSGAVPVTGWKKHRDNIYITVLDFRPERLFVASRSQPIARHPNEGWWRAQAVDGRTIIDAENIKTLESDLVGGEAYIWTMRGHQFFTVPVAALDRKNGSFTVVRQREEMSLNMGDRYYLKNHPSLIDLPGEWAVQKRGDKFRLYFWPVTLADLDAVEAPRRAGSILSVHKANHVHVSGLEVTAGIGTGIAVTQSEDVVIIGCISHNNRDRGILLGDVRRTNIRRNICMYNHDGVVLFRSEGVIVEENEIARNAKDGLIVSWNSADIIVRRNYIHHHLLYAHPDNIQLYRDVKNVRLIENLLIAGGQSIMMSDTSDGLLKGNMIIGCMAQSVLFGHQSAEDYRICNNTIAFTGYGCMSLSARDYEVRENVFVTGHGSPMYAVRGIEGYDGDHNLFFNAHGVKDRPVMASDRGWHRTFREYQNATGYDQRSVFGDPRFRNAPVAFAAFDVRRLADCSRSRLYLRGGVGSIRLTDVVEVNFDGVPRKVIDRSREAITVSPALRAKPVTPGVVCHWGRNSDLSLDLRLAANSPGAKLSPSGGPVGSTIDIAAYQRGDFDADGERDLPRRPRELELEGCVDKVEEISS